MLSISLPWPINMGNLVQKGGPIKMENYPLYRLDILRPGTWSIGSSNARQSGEIKLDVQNYGFLTML